MNDDNDDDGTLTPALRALLDDGGRGPGVPPGAADRLLGKVLLSVGVATTAAAVAAAATTTTATTTTATTAATTAATMTAATTAATTAAASVGTALGFKIVLALASVGALVSGSVVVSQRRAPDPTSRPAPAVAAPVALPPATSPTAPAEPVPVAPPPMTETATTTPPTPPTTTPPTTPPTTPTTTPPKTAPTAPTPVVSLTEGEETALLEQARAALARGDLDVSLLALAEHSKRAPRGQLVEEREGLRVFVLQRAGRGGEARSAAVEFLRRFPDSLLSERVRAVAEIQ